ncbi:HERV-H LTR-associating protein 1 [Ochotona curzoniae]|uniref:HERV-H LTR-associating protein 1 n=1 Tax=Ochotona curzoniae TaxID=130825 RepID=UPI001B3531E0|nr:HERV-H LTR-associating protein 1 [Ochotona curzoniae]
MLGFLLQGPAGRLCMGLTCVLSLWNTVSSLRGEIKREKGMTFLPATVSSMQKEERKEKEVAILATTELPARSVDLSALNLTELVNGMLSQALKESKKFLSLLSITSYSSFAFHKLSVAIYNISNLKAVDSAKFPARYCYCLNNRTNDLSDFTALLVDIIGNSTSYLTEIFKSTSILSVSQTNESDCIFICVMTGKSGRNLSDFWELAEKPPVINYTFTSSMTGVLGAVTRGTAGASKPTTKSRQTRPSTGRPHWIWSTPRTSATSPPHWMEMTTVSGGETPGTRGTASQTLPSTATLSVARTRRKTTNRLTRASTLSMPWDQTTPEKKLREHPWETHASTPTSPAGAQEATPSGGPLTPRAGMTASNSAASGTFTPGTQTPNPTKAPAPKDPQQIGGLPVERPFTPREEPALVPAPHSASRCPEPLVKEVTMTAAPLILAIQKLNPCLMELCRFFQQCLCTSRRNSRADTMRYCLDYYSWFLKNATFICPRVKTVSHSHTLKQKCLENICKSV